jgi:hypothetical protein
VDPTEFWDRLGSAKTDPGALAYRDQYQQYLLGRGADEADEFGGTVPPIAPTPRTNSPAGSGDTNRLAPFESPRTSASRPVPYLDSTRAAQHLFANVPPTDFPAFPSWARPGGAISPADPQPPSGSPALPEPGTQKRSAAPDGPAPTSAQGVPLLPPYFPGQASTFGDRSGNARGVPSPDTPLRRISSAFPA